MSLVLQKYNNRKNPKRCHIRDTIMNMDHSHKKEPTGKTLLQRKAQWAGLSKKNMKMQLMICLAKQERNKKISIWRTPWKSIIGLYILYHRRHCSIQRISNFHVKSPSLNRNQSIKFGRDLASNKGCPFRHRRWSFDKNYIMRASICFSIHGQACPKSHHDLMLIMY